MSQTTTVFRARVPLARLRKAEKILGRLGLKPADALNLMLAQIELRQGLPFAVTTGPAPLMSGIEQATLWNAAYGAY